MKIKKDNKNNPCHSALDAGVDSCQERACEVRGLRDEIPLGEQSRSKYSFITTWITQSSWVMTVFVFAFVFSLSACGEKKEEAKSDKPTIKIMLLVEAFEKADNKEMAVKELQKFHTFEGMTGKLSQDENGIFNSEAVMKVIQNGKLKVVKK